MKIRSRIPIITGTLLGVAGIASLVVGATLNQKVSATVPGINQLVSQSTGGTPANAPSSIGDHAISGNGRYVVFTSGATNLTSDGVGGVFLRDTVSNTTTLVSLSDTGSPVSGSNTAISYDGRYIVFQSSAANVVTGVTTGTHIYVRDLVNSTTRIADKNASGTVSLTSSKPDINADGRYVIFMTNDKNITGIPASITAYDDQVVIKDMNGLSGSTRIISGTPTSPAYSMQSPATIDGAIDCSGRVVSFLSNGSGLGRPFSRGNADYDLFSVTANWSSNTITTATASRPPLSIYTLGKQRPSCDGNTIVYADSRGYAQLYNRLTGAFTFVNYNSSGVYTNMTGTISAGTAATPSGDGRYIAFTDKGTNMDSSHPQTYKGTGYDVFVRDMVAGKTNLISFTALGNHSGRASNPNLSGDATTVAYTYTTDTSDPNSELISGINTGQSDIYISKTGY